MTLSGTGTRGPKWAYAAVILLLGSLLGCHVFARDAPHTVSVAVVSAPIELDGSLDSSAWRNAPVIELTQQSPDPGQPTPFRTKVMVLRDAHTLYVGFVCTDPDPAKIATSTLMRDGYIADDDHVTLVLDTFDARRWAYVFQVNAAGARVDGLLTPAAAGGDSKGADNSWNGVWQASVHKNSQGWTAVIAIDLRSLQFKKSASAWGFNVSRYVARKNLTLNWSGTTLDSSVYDLPREGQLTELAAVSQGSGLDFRPYGLVKDQSGSGVGNKSGFDLKYDFSPGISALLTYNTDFSEAQPDKEQINTTRFAVSFPETRQFFLEGSQLFTFGFNLSGGAGSVFIPYQSRDIGFLDGQTIPLNGGIKVLGQSDAGSIGLLDVQMGASPASAATNLLVGSGTYNATENLQLGTIVTHGDPTGATDNTMAGVDAIWKTSTFRGNKNLDLSAWTAHSSDKMAKPGSASGYGVGINYPNDLWTLQANLNVFGPALNPGLGFLPRPGTRQYYLELDYAPRPQGPAFDWIRQFTWGGNYFEVDGFNGGKQSSEWHFYPSIDTVSGYHYELDFSREYDVLEAPFETVPNVLIPAGRYLANSYGVEFNTPLFLPLALEASDYRGAYYTGTMHHPKIQLFWDPFGGKVQLTVSEEAFFAYLPQGDVHEHLSSFGATYSFTPNLYITSLAQYSGAIPGVSLYMQLHWIIGSASNIYLIWNRGLVSESTGLGTPIVASGTQLTFKVQWDFR